MKIHLLPNSIYSYHFIKFINRKFDASAHIFYVILPEAEEDETRFADAGSNVIILRERNTKGIFLKENPFSAYIHQADGLYLHYLDIQKVLYVYRYFRKRRIKIYWCIWGGDFYSMQNIDLLDPETKKIAGCQAMPDKPSFKTLLLQKFYKPILKQVLNRIDYVSAPAFRKNSIIKLNPHAQCMETKYPLSETGCQETAYSSPPGILEEMQRYRYRILIGNSGSITNNHLTILNVLLPILDQDVALIVPLSYGDEDYISNLVTEGKKLFGDRFIPLTEFYKPAAYNLILKHIDVAVWNHIRPQGFGNIRLLLELGKKIFYRRTPWSDYERLDKMGIVYEDTARIGEMTSDEICRPYSEEITQSNRRNLLHYYSDGEVYEVWKKLFEGEA